MNYLPAFVTACWWLRKRFASIWALPAPRWPFVLGSGLTAASASLTDVRSIDYASFPAFLRPRWRGHPGRLLLARWRARAHWCCVVACTPTRDMRRRRSASACGWPQALGVGTVVVTNVAGGIEPGLAVGEIVCIRDHLNLTGLSPLAGANDERLGLASWT